MAALSRIVEVRSFLLVLSIVTFSLSCAGFAQSTWASEEALPANSDAKISFDALKGLAVHGRAKSQPNPLIPR
jgi:hypothetical protein